jgi:hypothetical protein
VTQPQLYQSYVTEKIVSFFGAPGEAESFCNGQWLIFPKSVICLAHVGKQLGRSFFENGSHFYWVADQPYHVNDSGTYWHIVPAQVIGSAGKERAIHLFARPLDSPEFLYLGELEPSYMAVAPPLASSAHSSGAPVLRDRYLGLGLFAARRGSPRPCRAEPIERCHDGRIGADRRSVFAAIVEDAFPPRFNGRKQSLRPYCCSDAASEADHEYGHVLARTRTGLPAARCSDTRGTAGNYALLCVPRREPNNGHCVSRSATTPTPTCSR